MITALHIRQEHIIIYVYVGGHIKRWDVGVKK